MEFLARSSRYIGSYFLNGPLESTLFTFLSIISARKENPGLMKMRIVSLMSKTEENKKTVSITSRFFVWESLTDISKL